MTPQPDWETPAERDAQRRDVAPRVAFPAAEEEEVDGPPALWQLPDYWCHDPSHCTVAMPGGGRCDCFGITVTATACVYDRADATPPITDHRDQP